VDTVDYRVPATLQAATIALFAGSGCALAFGFQALLGDATWAVSTGKRLCLRGWQLHLCMRLLIAC
jgi:hypothetical protein